MTERTKYCNCGYAETDCSKGCEVDRKQGVQGMTIKTAQAWGSFMTDGELYSTAYYIQSDAIADLYQGETIAPVVIVHGLTESEVHEAAALLANSREVCEWGTVLYKGRTGYWTLCKEWERVCGSAVDALPTACVCGRRVVVKEG